jgi:hypothetical protein
MTAIYSNGGNRWNILGFNFTERDALSSLYKISMAKPPETPTPASSTSLVLLCFRVYLIYSILFSHTAPGGPPIDARTIGLSSHKLTLSWLPPDPELHNGIIIKYLICLRVVSTSPGPCLREMTHVLGRQDDPITKFTVSELKPYTKYGLNISAGTVVGFGPSASVVATTLETGNFLFLTAFGLPMWPQPPDPQNA